MSYQIIELQDSGLTQQGILPISAKNNDNSKAQMFEIPLASQCTRREYTTSFIFWGANIIGNRRFHK